MQSVSGLKKSRIVIFRPSINFKSIINLNIIATINHYKNIFWETFLHFKNFNPLNNRQLEKVLEYFDFYFEFSLLSKK